MEERKKCIDCKAPLIAQNGLYLHPEKPCSGLTDQIDIEATIRDDFLQEKFDAIYGKPRLDDYDRVTLLESHKVLLVNAIKKRDEIIKGLTIKKMLLKMLRKMFPKIPKKIPPKHLPNNP